MPGRGIEIARLDIPVNDRTWILVQVLQGPQVVVEQLNHLSHWQAGLGALDP